MAVNRPSSGTFCCWAGTLCIQIMSSQAATNDPDVDVYGR